MTIEDVRNDWKEQWKKLEEDRAVEQEKRLTELFAWLLELKVAFVEANYSGSGDEGFVDRISYLDEDKKKIDLTEYESGAGEQADSDADKTKEALEELIDSFVCAALPRGWEINEGSNGTVVIDVRNQTAGFDHNESVLVVDNQHWEEKWHIPTTTP